MKKIILALMLFGGIVFFTGCFDEVVPGPELRYAYATFYKTDGNLGFYFIFDGGQKLLPTNYIDVENFADSSRVIVTFDIEREYEQNDLTVIEGKIYVIEAIFTQQIIQLTENNKDSIGNDPVILGDNSVWLTDRHINMSFTFYGLDYSKHTYSLVKPIGDQLDIDGNQILEFRHNNNDDYPNYVLTNILSFSVDSLYQPGMDSINFVLRGVDGDTINFEYFDTFYFSEGSNKSGSIFTEHKLVNDPHLILK